MAVQLKKTKPKKEKLAKAPKAPKAEKPAKKDSAAKVKISKPAKGMKVEEPQKVKVEKPQKVKVEKPKKVKVEKPARKSKGTGGAKIASTTSSKKAKLKKIIILAVVVALVVALAGVLLYQRQQYNKQISHVLVSSSPEKLQYYVGDKPQYDGLKLQVVLNNGDSYFVEADECTFSGFDSSEAVDRQTITVSYQGFTCTYKVMIKDLPTPAKVLANIYLETLPKTEYKVNEWLNTKGGVLMVEYTDGTYMRHNLTNQDVYLFVTDVRNELYVTQQAGTYELEIRYREGGVTKTCTYTITVTE